MARARTERTVLYITKGEDRVAGRLTRQCGHISRPETSHLVEEALPAVRMGRPTGVKAHKS